MKKILFLNVFLIALALLIQNQKVLAYTAGAKIIDSNAYGIQCFKNNSACLVNGKYISSPNSKPLNVYSNKVCTSTGKCYYRDGDITYEQQKVVEVKCDKRNRSCKVGDITITSPNTRPLIISATEICTIKGYCVEKATGYPFQK